MTIDLEVANVDDVQRACDHVAEATAETLDISNDDACMNDVPSLLITELIALCSGLSAWSIYLLSLLHLIPLHPQPRVSFQQRICCRMISAHSLMPTSFL